MVNSNSNNSRDVMKADISLGSSGASNCWTRQMKDAFGDLQNGTIYMALYTWHYTWHYIHGTIYKINK